jgi:hypothetical protein
VIIRLTLPNFALHPTIFDSCRGQLHRYPISAECGSGEIGQTWAKSSRDNGLRHSETIFGFRPSPQRQTNQKTEMLTSSMRVTQTIYFIIQRWGTCENSIHFRARHSCPQNWYAEFFFLITSIRMIVSACMNMHNSMRLIQNADPTESNELNAINSWSLLVFKLTLKHSLQTNLIRVNDPPKSRLLSNAYLRYSCMQQISFHFNSAVQMMQTLT